MKQLFLAFMLILWFTTFIAHAQAPNIQGIPTGLTRIETEKIIQRLKPNFNKKSIRNHLNRPYGFTFSQDPERRGDSQLIISMDASEQVWFVAEGRNFAPGDRPDYASVRQALIDKYGTPTIPTPVNVPKDAGPYSVPEYLMGWSFDNQGKLVKTIGSYDPDKDQCDLRASSDDHSTTNGVSLSIPRTTRATCGMRILAHIRFDYYTKRVATLSVTIANTSMLYADPALGKASRDAEEKRKKLETESNSKSNISL